jgi:hypothetical protein
MDNTPTPPADVDKDQSKKDYHQDKTTNLQQLFSYLFFGVLTQFDDRYNVSGSNTNDELINQTNSTSTDSSVAGGVGPVNRSETVGASSLNEYNIEGVLDQIKKIIPRDPIELRQSTLYKSTMHLLQWQRDSYLVGEEYAEWRKNDRSRQEKQNRYFLAKTVTNYNIPYNPVTISHQHISSLASSFIPTAVVQNLLTPLVTGLFVKETGVLFDPIKQSTINLILDQQKLLEETIKNQLIQLLDNPSNRDAIKDSTQGIIIQTTKIDGGGPG